jgi:hypothetical protein
MNKNSCFEKSQKWCVHDYFLLAGRDLGFLSFLLSLMAFFYIFHILDDVLDRWIYYNLF